MEKNWREAKPKWVVDAAENEIAGIKRRLALRWPDEARPAPVEFSWGGYDRLTGTPVPGEYFLIGYKRHPESVHIREKMANEPGWKFSKDGEKWSDNVIRGKLYSTERDAKLAALWEACDEAAKELEGLWGLFIAERGFV